MSRRCSHCGNNGHNSRTCMVGTAAGAGAAGGFKLFGVRVAADSPPSACSATSMRKSFSMGNLSTYGSPDAEASPPPASPPEQPDSGGAGDASGAGYASDDLVHTNSSTRERKKGVPWTEEEHRSFLLGLQKLGKGDWRGISRNFVKTRTPTQVASHAQKYFLRRSNLNKRRRRSSLFDITPDTGLSLLEESVLEEAESEQVDACPELTLGQSIPHASDKGIEAALLLRRAYSVEDFAAPTLPPSYVPMEVPKASQEACENEGTDVCAMDSVSENALMPPVIGPVMNYLQNPNCDTAGGMVQPGFPFPFLAVWPAPWQFGADKQVPWSSETKVVKPTPILPNPPSKVDDTVKLSELSLNPTRPVMEPTPLSYQLMEEGSRNSAFHSMPNTSTGELDTKGNLSNAISVT